MMPEGSATSTNMFSSRTSRSPSGERSCRNRRSQAAGVVFPAARQNDAFVVGERLDLAGVAAGSIQAHRHAPIMRHQGHVLRKLKRLEPCIHVTGVIDEAISLGRGLARP